jgi:serine/threonine protein kinase
VGETSGDKPTDPPLLPTNFHPGVLIDRKYRLIQKLGEGGMGEVWQAEHTLLKREVALKLMGAGFGGDQKFQQKFLSEGRVLTELRHPTMVEAHDVGLTEETRLYLVMELVKGETLRQIIKRDGKLAIPDAVWVGREILALLDYAHGRGVIHRDLKPENIVLQGWGTPDRHLKVLDFGIAKIVAEGRAEAADHSTLAGWGTIQYMSPEQMIGDTVDARTDLYAVGAMLYEMMSGKLPLDAETSQKLAAKLLNEKPALLRAHRPEVPAALEKIIMQALEKNRDARPKSAAEFLSHLPETAATPAPAKRALWPIAAAAVLVVAGVSVGVSLALRDGDPKPPPVVIEEPKPPIVNPPPTDEDLFKPGAVQELRISKGNAYCVALSQDGKTMACGLDGGEIMIWDPSPRSISAGSGYIASLAFSADGAHLAAGSSDSTIRVWDAPFSGAPREWPGGDTITTLTFNGNGRMLASAGNDTAIRLWNLPDGTPGKTFKGHADNITSLSFSPDGTLLASGSGDYTVRAWTVATGELLRTFEGHNRTVSGVAFHPEGKYIVSCGFDKTLRFWDPATGKKARNPLVHLNELAAIDFSAKGRHLAVASWSGRVAVLNTETWESEAELAPASVFTLCGVAWSGDRLAACGRGPALVWTTR